MKGKFKLLGHIGLALFLVSVMVLTLAPVAQAATAVTDVWVEFPFTDASNDYSDSDFTNVYIVHFKPTTALSRGVDYVTVNFPDGSTAMGGDGTSSYAFTVSSTLDETDVLFSTNYDTTDLITGATWKRATTDPIVGGTRAKTRLPIDIAAGQDVWVKFVDTSGANAIASAATEADTYKVYVSTTKDTTQVLSSTFTIGDSTVTDASTAMETSYPVPTTAGSTAEYIIEFKPTATVTGSSGKVTLKFPVGTVLPSSITATNVLFGTDSSTYSPCSETPVVDTDRRMITAIPSVSLTSAATRYMKILSAAGITNPEIADASNYYVAIRTSVDGHWSVADDPYEITYGSANKVVVANGEIGKATTVGSGAYYSDDATMVNMWSSQIYVVLADVNGNGLTPAANTTLNVSSSSTTGTFAIDGSSADGTTSSWTTGVTSRTIDTSDSYDPAHANSLDDQIFYYKDSTAGTHTLTFSASGYTDATWEITVCPGVSVYDSNDALIYTYAAPNNTPVSETGGNSCSQKYSGEYINDAITGAMTGDTVKLGDGIYELDTAVSQNEKITLTSVNGASSTTLRNTTEINEAILVGISGTAANPVIIDGLTIERLRYGTEIRNAIWSKAYDYVTVRNCTFNYIMPDNDKDDKEGVVALVSSLCDANLNSLTVSNNTFNYCCTNEWPDLGDTAWDWAACINVMSSHTGYTVKGVSITGNTLNNCDGYSIAIGGMTAESSTLTGSVTNNTITNGFMPICSSGNSPVAGYSITGNTITGAYAYGIELEGTSNGVITVKNNTITGSALVESASAIRIPGESSYASTSYCTYVQYNDIYDNASGTYSIYVTTATGVLVTDINCNYNWFGDASGPAYTAVAGAVVTKSNPNGTGAPVSDGVYYYPWLHKPVTDVVADDASYQTSNMQLVSGWNTLSTPVKLISAADTIDELIPSGMTIGYYYDGGWQQITTGYTLSPCDAVYVKMSAATYVQFKFDAAAFTTPSKSLDVGWNLISLASLDSDGVDADNAVASVYLTADNLPGYAQVVSPSLNATQRDMYYNAGTSWTYSSGQTTTEAGVMYAGLGYWCYMQNAATLAGFEITPIAPDLD